MSDTPSHKLVADKLKAHEPDLLKAFAQVFKPKRPPQSMRALIPLALVLLLEAFGLDRLLDRSVIESAIRAARGPGKGGDDEDGQFSILDATLKDCFLGVFVSDISLRSESPQTIVECLGQKLDLAACETPSDVAWWAATNDWIVYREQRGAVPGLRLIPRTESTMVRLRAPLATLAQIVESVDDNKRLDRIAQLEAHALILAQEKEALKTQLSVVENNHRDVCDQRNTVLERLTAECDARDALLARDKEWQQLTGYESPNDLRAEKNNARVVEDPKNLGAFVGRELAGGEYDQVIVDGATYPPAPKDWKLVWPDEANKPDDSACVDTISAHRRGDFTELAFPASDRIFENVRAWLMFHSFGICSPAFDAHGWATCAIGTGGKIPPSWDKMKQAKRDAYPGFVLFAPDGSAKLVFCARNASTVKIPKGRKAKS